ncbi:hypothetical protein W97_04927 [Coniosporium apollinis CBS 100218]|uniref:Uncharacterized protein n=1 Tax=Coniosporium apollinis (strain CBS 100218) TaxID=1168221 RepID=R7YV23_CONA1|nr:uncharacterized protein W97_04927 [Coniosporium apollinis CBS 100218]EON65688.1 hypothetical protein W97_04927 [Coniosporium apollinis CBS 100218]
MTCTLYLPDATPNILLTHTHTHASSAHPLSFSTQRQQSIARLAKRIEIWSRREMVRKKAVPTPDTADTPLSHALSGLSLSPEERPASPHRRASCSSSSDDSDSDDANTPPSGSDITPREAKMLAHLRRPDHALIAMGHATLRSLIREARAKIADVETLLDAAAGPDGQEAARPPALEGNKAGVKTDVDVDVENKLQELLDLLHEFDEKLGTWTDVVTGRDGFGESLGTTGQEMERMNERGVNPGAAAMSAAAREPRVELLNLRRARGELTIGTEELLERRKERRNVGEKVEGWLAELGS